MSVVRFRNYKDAVTGIPVGIIGRSGYWHTGALAYFNKDGSLSFGDGWEKIEKESDISNSTPTSGGDHDATKYFANTKKAYLANKGTNLTSCAVDADDRPLIFFREDPAARKK